MSAEADLFFIGPTNLRLPAILSESRVLSAAANGPLAAADRTRDSDRIAPLAQLLDHNKLTQQNDVPTF